jgi:hypothetical protein
MSFSRDTLSTAQLESIRAYGGCDLASFENERGNKATRLGYDGHTENFIVVYYKTTMDEPGMLQRYSSHITDDYEQALELAQAIEPREPNA